MIPLITFEVTVDYNTRHGKLSQYTCQVKACTIESAGDKAIASLKDDNRRSFGNVIECITQPVTFEVTT